LPLNLRIGKLCRSFFIRPTRGRSRTPQDVWQFFNPSTPPSRTRFLHLTEFCLFFQLGYYYEGTRQLRIFVLYSIVHKIELFAVKLTLPDRKRARHNGFAVSQTEHFLEDKIHHCFGLNLRVGLSFKPFSEIINIHSIFKYLHCLSPTDIGPTP